MSLLEEPRNAEAHDGAVTERPDRTRPLRADDTIDLTEDHRRAEDELRTEHPRPHDGGPVRRSARIDPSGRIPSRGMRIRRVRIASVAKLSLVFWALAFGVLLGTTVVVWNVARAFGFIGEIETAVVTSLGLDSFQIDGGALFGIAAAVIGFLAVLGWVMTVLLAAVYNASCAVLGGLAVETGPLQRPKRVFSLRHRGFVTIRS